MYQPNHAPPFGSPQSRDSPGRAGGLSGAPSGLTDGHFRHNKPHLVRVGVLNYIKNDLENVLYELKLTDLQLL